MQKYNLIFLLVVFAPSLSDLTAHGTNDVPSIVVKLDDEKIQYDLRDLLYISVNTTNRNQTQNIVLTMSDKDGNTAFESFIPNNGTVLITDPEGHASMIFEIPETESGTYLITASMSINNEKYYDSVSFYVNATYPCGIGQQLHGDVCISDKESCLLSDKLVSQECHYDEMTNRCDCIALESEFFQLYHLVILSVISIIVAVYVIIYYRKHHKKITNLN